jgi:hypothetical protein
VEFLCTASEGELVAKRTIYKITILNWEKYNSKAKPGHPSIMLSKKFLEDYKIKTLPAGGKLLYLGLLLRRGDVLTTFVEASHDDLLRFAGGSGHVVERLLDLLKENQLLTYESLNIKEVKLKEEKIKESKRSSDEVDQPPSPVPQTSFEYEPKKNLGALKKETTENNRKIWEAYKAAYEKRYKVEPIRNATVNGQIANLGKRIGTERAIELVNFFLTHNDSYYVKTQHTIGSCLKDCESLHTQMLRGKAVTGTTARNYEKNQEGVSQSEMFRRLSEQAGNS